ncbi:FdtA/QdtA family cupin domain-containing protein [Flavobacteriaceae bacterium]|nr:FdtA/QdtA family cupin domain-containing protein [Flavobacteriaceae bacterium]
MKINNPKILKLPKIGEPEIGYISLLEKNYLLPFIPLRIYWIYDVPNLSERGGHYHHKLEQIIICIKGSLIITLENNNGFKKQFELDKPDKALFIPSKYWRDITFENNAVLLCIASDIFSEDDYIRDYQEFKNIF